MPTFEENVMQQRRDEQGNDHLMYPVTKAGNILDLTPGKIGAATAAQGAKADSALQPAGAGTDLTAAFTQAGSRVNLATGDRLSVIFGKLMKWYADLKTIAFTGSWDDLANKPNSFTPGAHTNATGSSVGQATASVFGHARAGGTPASLASSASAGTDNGLYARGDHQHAYPTASNVGAAASSHSHTPSSIGAAESSHSHSLSSIGAASSSHSHSPGSIGAADSNHSHSASSIGAAPTNHAVAYSTYGEGTNFVCGHVFLGGTPAALGSYASQGNTNGWAAYSNHVHPIPTAREIGAIADDEITSDSIQVASIVFVVMAEQGMLDDATISEHPVQFIEWDEHWRGKAGSIVRDEDSLYRALHDVYDEGQNHKPGETPSMWVRISNPNEEWPEWSQPLGSHDAYPKDAKVTYAGKRWISDVDNNTWVPGVYGWGEFSY